ncbi:MAG: hypothetical protein QXO24_03585 [Candidatus Micrarchaeaceae archaeon]
MKQKKQKAQEIKKAQDIDLDIDLEPIDLDIEPVDLDIEPVELDIEPVEYIEPNQGNFKQKRGVKMERRQIEDDFINEINSIGRFLGKIEEVFNAMENEKALEEFKTYKAKCEASLIEAFSSLIKIFDLIEVNIERDKKKKE